MRRPITIALISAVALAGVACTSRVTFRIAGEGTLDADPQNDAPEVVTLIPYNNGHSPTEPDPE